MPALPSLNELIGLPRNISFKVSISDTAWISLSGYEIFPFQKPLLETEKRKKFHLNKAFYSSESVYPDSMCQVSETMIWRGIKNVNLAICPFRWFPKDQRMDLLKEFTVRVDFSSKELNEDKLKANKLTAGYKRALKKHILNFDSSLIKSYYGDEVTFTQQTQEDVSGLKSTTTSTGYSYLIISKPTFSDSPALLELKEWKQRIGLKCKIVTTSTTGTSASDIKNYITNEYSNYGIEYVLFVGDHATNLPLYYWNDAYSDYWYGCVDPGGNSDYQAEVAIGRLAVNNSEELENIISKTIQYEQDPPVNNWIEKSLLIAHKEGAPDKYQGCKENIRNKNYSIFTPSFDKAYGADYQQGGNRATNQTIINAINDGRGLVNYRGHGSITGWDKFWNCEEEDEFNHEEINELTNATETPVILSIACNTAKIQASTDCFAENFTNGQNGAVAFLGATRTTCTGVNNTLDRELYNHIYDHGIYNIGNFLIEATIQTLIDENYTWCSKMNTEAYLWCGDPSLELWTQTLNEFNNVTITENSGDVTVSTGGVDECTICVMSSDDGGETYWDVARDVSSSTFSNVPRPYFVTITKHNYIPFLAEEHCPEYIIGSGPVCNSGKTFSLNLAMPDGSVSWSKSSNLTYISGQGTDTYEVKSNSNGSGWIEAEVSGCSVLRKNVWSGIPLEPEWDPGELDVVYANVKNTACVTGENDGASSYDWSIVGGTIHSGQGTECLIFIPYCTWAVDISVEGSNACGDGPSAAQRIDVICMHQKSILTVKPNPSDDYLTVTVEKEKLESGTANKQLDNNQIKTYKYYLYDLNHQLVKSFTTDKGTVQFNTNNLKEGFYILHVVIREKAYKAMIEVRH